jgi:TRAP-type mannitol/chloroaromatic compound transport system permease large subunit
MNRVFDIMRNDTLLAIPFFTFMGLILERSRMAEDLLDTIGQLFGTLRGGLAYAVISSARCSPRPPAWSPPP